MVLHYSEMTLRPHLENSAQFFAWAFKRDVDKLECVQRKDQGSENHSIFLGKRR